MKTVILKKSPYESSKISVKRSKLYSKKKIKELSKLNFDEILKFLEEHDFKKAVDTSYLQFEGFYLIERVLNTHSSRIYKEVFSSISKNNQVLLENYYLKYQIHNLMALIRCKISNEDNFESFLIGDERKKSKFIKAFEMPNLEDSIIYICKKIKFNPEKVLEAYKKGLYFLENYLYKEYYKNLSSIKFKYNNIDENKFFKFIKRYIDLLNSRTFIRLKIENIKELKISEIYIEGGNLNLNYFENLLNKSISETLDEYNKEFGKIKDCSEESCLSNIDKRINLHKKKSGEIFKIVTSGSPFYILKYLFEVEQQTSKLRILLKAKYLKLTDEEILKLI